MSARVNYYGLVVAGIGFVLTRFTVTLAIYEDPLRFYLAGVVPLVLGLGLAAFGVAIAVADVDPSLVRTTALWCVVGTTTMLMLVVLTLLGSHAGEMPATETLRSQTYLSNFLVGGSVGGTLTGLYAARSHRQRAELRQQTRRLQVLNRVLRHEVLNAVNVIQGRAAGDGGATPDELRTIRKHSTAIERTIQEVKYLARGAEPGTATAETVDLGEQLAASVERVREAHPDARITVDAHPDDLPVRATGRVEEVFAHLLENAVVHPPGDAPSVAVSVATTARDVRVSVRDEGPGLPERQQALLETGEIGEFDDPGAGFGLNVVRLLVESYGGAIATDVEDGATTITVTLLRADASAARLAPDRESLAGVRPALPHLVVTLGAAVVAGVAYGAVSTLLGGSVAGIGVFYGATSPVVGWITHEFHSVVFGFVFAGLVSLAPPRYRDHALAHVAIGVGWALALWVVAAGLVAPVWLRLLGIDAGIPNLTVPLLASHLVWGVSLGALTAWGYEHVAPRLARAGVTT